MKARYWHILLLGLLFSACSRKPAISYKNPQSLITDSFTISGLVNGLEDLNDMNYLNDSTFYSTDYIKNELLIYRNSDSNKKLFQLKKKISLSTGPAGDIGFITTKETGGKTCFYYFSKSKQSILLCNIEGTPIASHHFDYTFPVLGKNFNLTGPARITGDTLVALIINNFGQQYFDYLKEKIFVSFICNKDTLQFIGQFARRPYHVANYLENFPSVSWQGGRAFTIFPSFDTLYSFNAISEKAEAFPIRNKDFAQPAKITDYSNFNEEKQVKYAINNFSYAGIVSNKITQHLLAFYVKPQHSNNKDSVPNIAKTPVFGIVMTDKGKIINYYKFGSQHITPEGISLPNGVAILKHNRNANTSKVTFYIMHF